MERTPLEKAKACCGKHLTDKGTDRLLADIASAPDRDMTLAEAEAELYEHTHMFSIHLLRSWQVNNGPRTTKWTVTAAVGDQEFKQFSSSVLRLAVAGAVNYMAEAKLPTAHEVTAQIDLEQPERFCEATGPFGKETDHDRHNDDDRQRAAQERADREGGEA